ncbi:hypothetical protein A1Q2_07670 [Trichosporon asahii var. asahii CBS 8904]|uniref:Uncharacterized protein n=1 Tax=Trichosporon asahii var. asahii (strain CBS 8904) TaxID=1220162 RepID=K1V2K9_TRIAC|nr:hypothetical protein A1Q2_07670 [Trichosporon asahii var. asahii CBS 8904]
MYPLAGCPSVGMNAGNHDHCFALAIRSPCKLTLPRLSANAQLGFAQLLKLLVAPRSDEQEDSRGLGVSSLAVSGETDGSLRTCLLRWQMSIIPVDDSGQLESSHPDSADW